MKTKITALLLTLTFFGLCGCPSFDRDAFNTLSVTDSALKTAQADYEARTLPHNQCVHDLITDGKTAQGVAQEAFLAYWKVEQAKGDVSATQAALVADLAHLTPIVTGIKALYTNPVACAATSEVLPPQVQPMLDTTPWHPAVQNGAVN